MLTPAGCGGAVYERHKGGHRWFKRRRFLTKASVADEKSCHVVAPAATAVEGFFRIRTHACSRSRSRRRCLIAINRNTRGAVCHKARLTSYHNVEQERIVSLNEMVQTQGVQAPCVHLTSPWHTRYGSRPCVRIGQHRTATYAWLNGFIGIGRKAVRYLP